MNLLSIHKRKNNLNTDVAVVSPSIQINDKIEFFTIIQDIISNETVQKMREYKQHCDTSCYDHCLHVAYYSYYWAKKMGLDYRSTARAAMLHDLFLYNWRKKYRDLELPGLHAFVHPQIALSNSEKLFQLNEKEKDIILKHMWPVTLHFPRYTESFIVSTMDKYSACKESFLYFRSSLKRNRIYKYAYIFLSLIIFRIV